jgi:hypothetical protein
VNCFRNQFGIEESTMKFGRAVSIFALLLGSITVASATESGDDARLQARALLLQALAALEFHDRLGPPTVPDEVQTLHTAYVETIGFVQCTVVNVSASQVDTSIEIRFHNRSPIGPIGGPLNPGGVWVVNWFTLGEYARGVATVKGSKTSIRSACTFTETDGSSTGFALEAT